MERITLYHGSVPVTHHALCGEGLTIGSHPTNDLVLAAGGVAERHLVVLRGPDGLWRARTNPDDPGAPETAFAPGDRVSVGPFSLALTAAGVAVADEARPAVPAQARPEAVGLGIVGNSPRMRLLRAQVARLGRLKAPVLVTGETGTGKELVARGLHECSARRSGPFVAVNCGSLTSSLLEDALFGHERGAFTGAQTAHRGLFEQAHGGTLFLDELGELPMAQQAALLRVLDDGRVRRIGQEGVGEVSVRLVAATNRDLSEMAAQGAFRADLFHRVSTLCIATAPLRDHPEDIADLCRHFLATMADDVGRRSLDAGAVERLAAHDWPGNARELRAALYRAAALSPHPVLTASDFALATAPRALPRRIFRLEELSDTRVSEIVSSHKGNVASAAREIGVPRSTLRDRLRRVGGDGVSGCCG
ncbi:MAG: sigma 54-interacting transcriptional regulator [Deltaproteobacteria bacterium]|nr:sigma 54-interacting transcriptional regulator [Deltaproteobacteria bacterium]